MSKPKRSLEDSYITTGGAGYIPPVDITPIINNIFNLWNYSKSYLKNKL